MIRLHKIIVLFQILTGSFSIYAAPGNVSSPTNSQKSKPKNLAGTQPRLEKEVKIAIQNRLDEKVMSKLINQTVKDALQDPNIQFTKLTQKRYEISKKSKPFAFRDHYFDDKNLTLSKNGITYRLRYRWSKWNNFKQHLAFPFLEKFYPTRCEIQLKTDYTLNPDGTMTAQETRFEFRNESHPFSQNKNAPPPPWPVKEYEQYAKYGKFQNYVIYPYHELKKRLGDQSLGDLEQSIVILTKRTRSHLRIRNKWGWGPNPDQAFIVTLDYVRPLALGVSDNVASRDWKNQSFYELEIEIDRSIFTNILTEIRNPTNATTLKEAQLAKSALENDLQIFKSYLNKKLASAISSEISKPKYTRIVELIQ